MKESKTKEFDFLDAVELISDVIEEGNSKEVSARVLNGTIATEAIRGIGRTFDLTDTESAFFAVIFYLQLENVDTNTFKGIANYLSMPNIEVLRKYKVFLALKRKELININNNHGGEATKLYILPAVMRQVLQGNYEISALKEQTVFGLCQRVYNFLDRYHRSDYGTGETRFLMEKEFDLFSELPELIALREMGLETVDLAIFFYVAYFGMVHKQSKNIFGVAHCFLDDMKEFLDFQNDISKNQAVLVRSNLIEYAEADFHGRDSYELGSTGRQIMGMAIKDVEKFNFKTSIGQLVDVDDKIEQKLYFSDAEQKEVKQITSLLKVTNYKKYVRKMRKIKSREGLTFLFYGPSGTGKTQLAYELARSCGRKVFLVNSSCIRDKFVGESEKNVAQIFSDYKRLCQETDRTPILLLNESDSLISKRMQLNGATDQMNNSMQNILLQKLEDFDGILIATTNLTRNLDKAFERRFLVKLRIGKPNREARLKMLKDNLPEVETKTLHRVAAGFGFTGGQIENVARRWSTNNLISGDVSENRLYEIIQQELRIADRRSDKIKKIGFYNN